MVSPQPLHKSRSTKTREEYEEEREVEADGDTLWADQLPQNQTQPSQEQQPHDDAEIGKPAPDPLRSGTDSAGTDSARTEPEKG